MKTTDDESGAARKKGIGLFAKRFVYERKSCADFVDHPNDRVDRYIVYCGELYFHALEIS